MRIKSRRPERFCDSSNLHQEVRVRAVVCSTSAFFIKKFKSTLTAIIVKYRTVFPRSPHRRKLRVCDAGCSDRACDVSVSYLLLFRGGGLCVNGYGLTYGCGYFPYQVLVVFSVYGMCVALWPAPSIHSMVSSPPQGALAFLYGIICRQLYTRRRTRDRIISTYNSINSCVNNSVTPSLQKYGLYEFWVFFRSHSFGFLFCAINTWYLVWDYTAVYSTYSSAWCM